MLIHQIITKLKELEWRDKTTDSKKVIIAELAYLVSKGLDIDIMTDSKYHNPLTIIHYMPLESYLSIYQRACYLALREGNYELITNITKSKSIVFSPSMIELFKNMNDVHTNIDLQAMKRCLDILVHRNVILQDDSREILALFSPAKTLSEDAKAAGHQRVFGGTKPPSLAEINHEIRYLVGDTDSPTDNQNGSLTFLQLITNPKHQKIGLINISYDEGVIPLLELVANHPDASQELKTNCQNLLNKYSSMPDDLKQQISIAQIMMDKILASVEKGLNHLMTAVQGTSQIHKQIEVLVNSINELVKVLKPATIEPKREIESVEDKSVANTTFFKAL